MASSPPAPFPASLPNPRKRPSISSQASAGPLKRPKLHPLRQTSFPANSEAVYASAQSARSETASVAPSTFSTTSTARIAPRGRGRPRKSLQVTDEDAQTFRNGTAAGGGGAARGTTGRNNNNTTSKSVISAARSGANAAGNLDDEDDEDEEDAVHEHSEDDDNENAKDNAQHEADRLNTFLGQLSDAQMNRYQNYRSSSLKTSVIRRIVNQTLSQSVGKTQIDAVQFFSKAFAIEIIERAREIQAEWAETKDAEVKRERETRKRRLRDREDELATKQKALEDLQRDQQGREVAMRELAVKSTESSASASTATAAATATEELKKGDDTATTITTATATPPPPPTQPSKLDAIKEEYKTTIQALTTLRSELTKLRAETPKLRADAERYIPNKHRGGLLPDHLREALRRYKSDGEGGGFGFDGVSHPLLGVEGAVTWRVGDGNIGQRLFR